MPLFDLCWRVTPDPAKITAEILNEKPEMLRQYISFLLGLEQTIAVVDVAPRLVRSGDPHEDLETMLAVVNRLVVLNNATGANKMWNLLIQQNWVTADSTVPNNANFQREPLPVSFDWSLSEYQGLHSWPGSSGLETEFTGSEPEDCVIAEQFVTLTPGNYALNYSYRTSEIKTGTGIHWRIFDAMSNQVLAESTDLSSEELAHSSFGFSVAPGDTILRVSLSYQRTLGTPRISGTLDVVSTKIESIPNK
jgi:hypothetical protein